MTSLIDGTLESTVELISEMTKLTRILISHGSFGDLQDELMKRANVIIDEMEKFCVLFKKDCILFVDISTKSQVENMELRDELVVVKKERDDLREEVTRLKEDERKAWEWAKTLQETLAKDCEEHSHMINEKSDMISELNVKVTNLKNQVLENDQMLNKFRERLKCMEVKVGQKEQEANDLKHQYSAALKNMEEKLKNQVLLVSDQMLNDCKEEMRLLEEKVQQKEQELHDFMHQRIVAYQIKEEKLKNQVLEKDETLNKCRERLKYMEVEVAKKRHEVNDLKHQNSVALISMEERLKNQELESDQLLNTCKERLKFMEAKVLQLEQDDLKHQKSTSFQISEEKLKIMEANVVQKEQEVRELNHQKLAAYQIIRKLTHKQTEENQREQELRHQQLAAYQIIEKLKLDQAESSKNAEELRHQSVEASEKTEKFKKLYLVVERDKLKVDDELKDIKEKQLEVDKHLEEDKQKKLVALQAVKKFKEWMLAADESFEVNKEKWEGSPRNKTLEEGLIRMLKIKVLDLANSVLTEADVNSLIPKGGRESLRMLTGINKGSGIDDDSLDQAGLQFHSSTPQVEASCSANLGKGTEKSHYSGIIVAVDTVEVANRDDEAGPGESKYNPKRKGSPGNRNGNLQNKTQKPSHEIDESLGIKSNTPAPATNSQTRIWSSSSDLEDESYSEIWTSSSDSEDESYSDSVMNDMVRVVRFENLRKTWKSESDMLKDFQQDVELCMDAVCVLYRWKIRESDSPAYSGLEVSHFDAMGGCSLAKYLINDDPVCRLRKFVFEVEKEMPNSLVQCRKIATDYCEKLFSIYCSGNDLFFKS